MEAALKLNFGTGKMYTTMKLINGIELKRVWKKKGGLLRDREKQTSRVRD
mgnify:CR=1 FL=1